MAADVRIVGGRGGRGGSTAQAARTARSRRSARRTARTARSRRSARRTAHGARRTAHGARRTAHGARRTAHGAQRMAHGSRRAGALGEARKGERGVEAGHWRAYRLRQAATGAAGSMEPLRSTPRLAFPREQLAVGVCSVAGSTPCASEPGLVTSSRCRARNQAAETECGREARGGVGGWGGGARPHGCGHCPWGRHV